MKISEFLYALSGLQSLVITNENGQPIPAHFHVTEVGQTRKNYIDCGGTMREDKCISMQLWVAEDVDHRLSPQKLATIILQSANLWNQEDLPIEMEYQENTIGRYNVAFSNGTFQLISKQTACLAPDQCGIPQEKTKVKLSELNTTTCKPGSGCC
ncbi:MAG: hypothetical protein RLZZ94_142 [Bacteroidota bacterium]